MVSLLKRPALMILTVRTAQVQSLKRRFRSKADQSKLSQLVNVYQQKIAIHCPCPKSE
jgi:hypothetical protein